MKRLVLFVEGEGDVEAVPILVKRILAEVEPWDALVLDERPFRVKEINSLIKSGFLEWHRKLQAALKRKDVGGILLLLDSDVKVSKKELCPAQLALVMAGEARKVGAAASFSVAVVFAKKEFESWLIAGIESLAGLRLPDGRLIAPPGITAPEGDLELSPRNAKGWLDNIVDGGYKQTLDQKELTRLVDLSHIRARGLRSFRRLESALAELVAAFKSGSHISSPSRD